LGRRIVREGEAKRNYPSRALAYPIKNQTLKTERALSKVRAKVKQTRGTKYYVSEKSPTTQCLTLAHSKRRRPHSPNQNHLLPPFIITPKNQTKLYHKNHKAPPIYYLFIFNYICIPFLILFSFQIRTHEIASLIQNGGAGEPLELGRRRLRPVEVISVVAISADSPGAR